MKLFLIFAAAFTALLCVRAIRLPYILSDSSEEDYHILIPSQNVDGQLDLSSLGNVKQPVLEAVKVKEPPTIDGLLKLWLMERYLAEQDLRVKDAAAEAPIGQNVSEQDLVLSTLLQQNSKNNGWGFFSVITQNMFKRPNTSSNLPSSGQHEEIVKESGGAPDTNKTVVVKEPSQGIIKGQISHGLSGISLGTKVVDAQKPVAQVPGAQKPSTGGLSVQAGAGHELSAKTLSSVQDYLLQSLLLQNPNNNGWGFLNVVTQNAPKSQVIVSNLSTSAQHQAIEKKRGEAPVTNKIVVLEETSQGIVKSNSSQGLSEISLGTEVVDAQKLVAQVPGVQKPNTGGLSVQAGAGHELSAKTLASQQDFLLRSLLLQNPNNYRFGFLNINIPNAATQTEPQEPLADLPTRTQRHAVEGPKDERTIPFNNVAYKDISKESRFTLGRAIDVIDVPTAVVNGTPEDVAHEATTQPNCDINCTKFQFNPICAFNGECYHEFANQCVMDTFVCKYPDLGFKATPQERCTVHLVKRCNVNVLISK